MLFRTLFLLGFLLIASDGVVIRTSQVAPLAWQATSFSGKVDPYYHYYGELAFCLASKDTGGQFLYGFRDASLANSPCTSPGPVVEMTPGTNYLLLLRNEADVATNLHTHGLHLSGSGNADNIFRDVSPNSCLGYNYSIPSIHAGGTFWMHPHIHGNTYPQVNGGALSMLIVNDHNAAGQILLLPQNLPANEFASIERFLTVGEVAVFAYKSNGGVQIVALSETFFSVPLKQWTRLRLAVADPTGLRTTFSLLDPSACDVRVVATDGNYLEFVPSSSGSKWALSASGRLDFALYCTAGPSVGFQIYGETFNLSVEDQGEYQNPSPISFETVYPPYMPDLRKVDVSEANKHSVEATPSSIRWDNVPYVFPNSPSQTCNLAAPPYRSNEIYELKVLSSTTHPIHLHVWPMQVIGECEGLIPGAFYDTISTTTSGCLVRFYSFGYDGRVVLHCHNLRHEDLGAMTWFEFCDGLSLGSEICPPDEQISCPELGKPLCNVGLYSTL